MRKEAAGGRERRGEEGACTAVVLRTSRTSTGARGRLEVVGGRGVNGREHADVLQSAQMAGTRGFFSHPHAPTCVWQLQGGVNNVAMALDALGIH